jgi:hypothetical protein
MRNRSPLRSLVLTASLAVAGDAFANDTYFTVGVANGTFEGAAPSGCVLLESSADGTGGGLGVGYRFNDPFAIEFGYQTLGSLDLRANCGLSTVTVVAPDSGLAATGVGRLRFGQGWALLGRAGLYSWSSAGDGGTEAVLGVGAEHEWRKGIAARLEYMTIGPDIDAISIALRFGF